MVASSAWHVLSAGMAFLAGGVLALRCATYFCVPWRRALFIYGWHTIFCLLYMAYSLGNVADARTYYEMSLTYSGGFGVSSPFIYLFTAAFTRLFGFSYIGAFLVFNIIGYLGLIATYGALRVATEGASKNWKNLALILVLLPSASFWTSAIGKDAISFMAIGFALWSALDLRRRYLLMAVAIAAMFLVRPHMAALMASALAFSVVFGLRVPLFQRVILGGAVALISFAAIPFALNYAGLGASPDAGDVIDYIELRQEYNMSGGGSVDISAMNPASKLLTYLIRPLPHEAHSVPALAASIDNVILVLLIVLSAINAKRSKNVPLPGNRQFLWLYVISSWVVLAMTTANLGISMRQKWMFLPALMFLLLSNYRRRPAKVLKSNEQVGGRW